MNAGALALALLLAACGGDATGPEPYQGAPCEADIAAAIAEHGEPVEQRGADPNPHVLTFVQDGDTTVYTFTPHYDDVYWCEVDIQL